MWRFTVWCQNHKSPTSSRSQYVCLGTLAEIYIPPLMDKPPSGARSRVFRVNTLPQHTVGPRYCEAVSGLSALALSVQRDAPDEHMRGALAFHLRTVMGPGTEQP